MITIRFEDPPAPRGRRWGRHHTIADQLRARPAEWAVIGTYAASATARSIAYQLRSGHRRAYQPVGEWEITARTVAGEYRVYARYTGGAS